MLWTTLCVPDNISDDVHGAPPRHLILCPGSSGFPSSLHYLLKCLPVTPGFPCLHLAIPNTALLSPMKPSLWSSPIPSCLALLSFRWRVPQHWNLERNGAGILPLPFQSSCLLLLQPPCSSHTQHTSGPWNTWATFTSWAFTGT